MGLLDVKTGAEAHWARIRASIPDDYFSAPIARPTVRIDVTDDEPADILAFRTRRAVALEDYRKAINVKKPKAKKEEAA